MKRKEIFMLSMVAATAALISYLVSGALFNSTAKRSTKVFSIDKISTTFPDIKTDASYQSFLNPGALDATQPIQIGNSKNSNPFNSQ